MNRAWCTFCFSGKLKKTKQTKKNLEIEAHKTDRVWVKQAINNYLRVQFATGDLCAPSFKADNLALL